jgi:hypothetical protein
MKELLEALQKFQDEVVFVKATDTANYGKYAKLKTVVISTRPALKKNGLHVFQSLTSIGAVPAIRTTLIHTETAQEQTDVTPLVHRPEDPQKWAAAVTYAKRITYATILGLLVDDDDDGELASAKAELGSWVEDAEEQITACSTVQELAKLFEAMPPKQRVETTKTFTKRKLEINNATK